MSQTSMVRMTGAMVRLHPMSLLTQLLTLTSLLSLVRGETQTQAFRAQPGDVTVQAGDKVKFFLDVPKRVRISLEIVPKDKKYIN